jgi:hypothetical protein
MSKEKTPIDNIISMLEDIKAEQVDVDTLIFKISLYKADFKEAIVEAVDYGREYRNLDAVGSKYYNDKYGK